MSIASNSDQSTWTPFIHQQNQCEGVLAASLQRNSSYKHIIIYDNLLYHLDRKKPGVRSCAYTDQFYILVFFCSLIFTKDFFSLQNPPTKFFTFIPDVRPYVLLLWFFGALIHEPESLMVFACDAKKNINFGSVHDPQIGLIKM